MGDRGGERFQGSRRDGAGCGMGANRSNQGSNHNFVWQRDTSEGSGQNSSNFGSDSGKDRWDNAARDAQSGGARDRWGDSGNKNKIGTPPPAAAQPA